MSSKDSPLYFVWTSMRYRCSNPNSPEWARYGGRGINVCTAWDSYPVFFTWAWDNGYKPGLELDRIDNDRGYSPDNCRFVSRMVNQNNRRNTKLYEYLGMMRPTREIYDALNNPAVDIRTFQDRLRHGMLVAEAAYRPKRKHERKK